MRPLLLARTEIVMNRNRILPEGGDDKRSRTGPASGELRAAIALAIVSLIVVGGYVGFIFVWSHVWTETHRVHSMDEVAPHAEEPSKSGEQEKD
jgi:hypothetical protein